MNYWMDLKYGWRLARESWSYSLMCVSILALSVVLGIWAYEVVYAAVLRPLGFPDSDRWYSVQIAASAPEIAAPAVDAYTYQELLKQNRSAHYLGASESKAIVLSESHVSTSLRASAISPGLLAATQVPPVLGRVFQDAESEPGAAAVAVISFDTWQNYFAADPAIVGKMARFDAAPVQIIGVMPKNFYQFSDFEVWVPLHLPILARPGDSSIMVTPLILLGRDQKLDPILNEMKAVVDAVNRDYPNLFKPTRYVALVPALRMFTQNEVPIDATLTLTSIAVLLLGCVDISLVFLARLLERSRELALRTALGASRSRLLRQCVLETALVVPPGLLVGWGLAAIVFHWARSLYFITSQVLETGRPAYVGYLKPRDLAIAFFCAVTVWLLSTMIPAWRLAKQDAAMVLAGGSGGTIKAGNKSAGLLVGVQVVISCLVLVLCLSMVLGIEEELGKPSGLDTANVMLSTYPTVFSASYSDASTRLRYWENLTAAIESKIPGAEVAYATAAPTRPGDVEAAIEGQQGRDHQGTLTVPFTVVSDNYFKMFGLTQRSGRLFDTTDNGDTLKVAVVDEQLAARYWPNQDVLGKRVQLNPSSHGPWLTVVGVISAVNGAPYSNGVGVIYQPLRQAAPPQFQLLVKLPGTGGDVRGALRTAAYETDRDLPLHNLQTLDDYIAVVNLGYPSLIKSFIVVAILTALLAGSGLYGLVSRSVAQRTQEVGIRRALGATSWQAISIFFRQGLLQLSVALVGIGLGTMIASMFSAVVPNILEHVGVVTVAVLLLMSAVIFTASLLPSRRAVALEPGDALRYE